VNCKEISQLEKAGAETPAQQSEAGKLVKVVVVGKLHRRGGKTTLTSHVNCK
jgi:hypothetical protein